MAVERKSISGIAAVVLLFLAGEFSHINAKLCKVSCVRQPVIKDFGFDPLMQQVLVDVGKCRQDYDIQEGCDVPLQNSPECTRRCEPRSYEMVSRSNRSGPLSIQTVRSCYATRHHCEDANCERKPNYVYMFPDSRYQTRVDVGKCVGSCNNSSTEGAECLAVRNVLEVVQGPNGPVTVDKIVECSCQAASCYRADYFQSVWDFSHGILANNSTRRKEKVINVGRCVGTCSGIILPETCYPSEADCVFRVPAKPAKCVPIVGRIFTFADARGNAGEIAAVAHCGCSTG